MPMPYPPCLRLVADIHAGTHAEAQRAHEVPGSDPVPPLPEPPPVAPPADPDDPLQPGIPVREPTTPRPPLHVVA